jgi:two-component system, LytTR family, sensor kinase
MGSQKKIRFLHMFLAGIGITLLLKVFKIGNDHPHPEIFDYLITILITFLIWEGNLRIDCYLEKLFPWKHNAPKRALIQLIIVIIFSALGIYLSMLVFDKFVCALPSNTRDGFMTISVVLGVLISIMIVAIQISAQFFANWKQSLLEIEKYKNESLQAQLQNLKSQINPHFLFNNMSVLSSLVYKDQDKAVEFINQLSKVYRYLLDSKDSELVTLDEEMAFIKSYIYLLKIRFDSNIQFTITVGNDTLNKLIPPMSIQILVENTIKHNEVSSEQPLSVIIHANADELSVSNNLQLRTNREESLKTGLKNIKERYKYFTEKSVEIIDDAGAFTVKLPLLQTS